MPAPKTVSKRKNLPQPPSLIQTLGPSFILLGLALGSGELILWPYLTANYGLGLLWGALLGVSFQFVLNTEIMRYSLAKGESVFLGLRQISILIPIWFLISTFIPWSLPGFSSATSQIITQFFNVEGQSAQILEKVVAIGLFVGTGLILTVGKTLYKTMEVLQRSIIILGLPLIIAMVFMVTKKADWVDVGWGIIGRGDGWWFFPPGIGLMAFLGAFAYSGAGGNLNLAQSYYIKEKGLGMGKYSTKITSLFAKNSSGAVLEGQIFKDTSLNRNRWSRWWKLINTEHFLVFWTLGFLTIVLMAVMARTLTAGAPVESGLSFLYQEAAGLSTQIKPIAGPIFLGLAALMLFSTQLGVLESSSRIISENVILIGHKRGRKVNLSLGFYIALWAQIGLGIAIYLAGWQEPRFLLTLAAVLNAAAMMVSFPLIYWLNHRSLPKAYQPNKTRRLAMLAAFLFFLTFVILTIQSQVGH